MNLSIDISAPTSPMDANCGNISDARRKDANVMDQGKIVEA